MTLVSLLLCASVPLWLKANLKKQSQLYSISVPRSDDCVKDEKMQFEKTKPIFKGQNGRKYLYERIL